MQRIGYSSFLLFILTLLAGCRHDGGKTYTLPMGNAAYYWRTTWQLDSVESQFLKQYDVKRLYCRYFDVVMRDGEPMPNATLRFPLGADGDARAPIADGNGHVPKDAPNDIEIIPTVYITEDCMRAAPAEGWQPLAKRLVERIVQMNATHNLPPSRELQIDCDYTRRSRQNFYDFLALVRREADAHGMRLSVTIRLHQLSMAVPPADYGVLMIYNTGDPQRFAERNPILDIRDVQPYMRYLADYPLPLATAYPVYRWQRTIHGVRIEHSVEAEEILSVKRIVEQTRADMSHTIIIYSLDKDNIQQYDHDTFREIYRH